MKKIVLLLMMISCLSVFAEDNYRSVITSAPNGRFEIVQSSLSRKYTIKLDKETGDTWQMVKDSNDDISFEKIYREQDFRGERNQNSINFQIFMGGISAADLFLINVNTGETWQLCKNSKIGCFWSYLQDRQE